MKNVFAVSSCSLSRQRQHEKDKNVLKILREVLFFACFLNFLLILLCYELNDGKKKSLRHSAKILQTKMNNFLNIWRRFLASKYFVDRILDVWNIWEICICQFFCLQQSTYFPAPNPQSYFSVLRSHTIRIPTWMLKTNSTIWKLTSKMMTSIMSVGKIQFMIIKVGVPLRQTLPAFHCARQALNLKSRILRLTLTIFFHLTVEMFVNFRIRLDENS